MQSNTKLQNAFQQRAI